MTASSGFDSEFRLPDVGEGLEEAEIVEWKVSVGQRITVNQPILDIETAKSLVELPSPYTGTVLQLLVQTGQTVPVGTPIILIRADDPAAGPSESTDSLGPAGAPSAAAGEAAPAAAVARTEILVGSGPRTEEGRRRGRTGRSYRTNPAASVQPVVVVQPTSPPPVLSTPPVRKFAREMGIDLSGLAGSGPSGSITRADVLEAAALLTQSAVAQPAVPVQLAAGSRETRHPIRGVRKATAAAMVSSAFTAPHVSEFITVDVTNSMTLLDRLRGEPDFAGVRLSPLALVARAMCIAARRTPEVNSRWDEAAQEIAILHYVNLGIATATDRGLLVPNIKDADQLDLRSLAVAISEAAGDARSASTTPAQMRGATMSITNVGVFGIDTGTPILPPGESAILCLGAVAKRPWVVGDEIVVRQVSTLSLSFDHRLVDGAQGSRFLSDIAAALHDPGWSLAWA